MKPGFIFMNHSEKLKLNLGIEKTQETMYCQEDNKCSEGYVCHFTLNTGPETWIAVLKGRGITGKFYHEKVQ